MKKSLALAACFVFLGFGTIFAEPVQEVEPERLRRHILEIAPEMSYIYYEEPAVMEERGFMYGVSGSYTYRGIIMIRLESRFSYGTVDYKNSGEVEDIPDYLWESRVLLGFVNILRLDKIPFTPYAGIGYRYLNDDMSGKVSTTGAVGYERESNYLYSPIGLEIDAELGKGWFIGLTLEYDHFWLGLQKSHLSDAGPGYYDIENDQEGGYGFRGSIRIEMRHADRIDFVIEPFIRFWSIEESKETTDPAGRTWVEPRNRSTEAGCRLAMRVRF